jgi:hypothetical protein
MLETGAYRQNTFDNLVDVLFLSHQHVIKARDGTRITAAEMKYMRRIAGYTWTDHKTNTEIAKELKFGTSFGQNTGLQEKLDTTCKSNAT